ncbi:hypothetical protein MMC25_001196 [Agyrium rufum]|nr:hypothetical protein [Agyrium rufum]
MATTHAPDPNTFQSWEDAFKYPIPVVRQMEKQLRIEAQAKKDKLRSLVGGSYRDLLGTAETIISMDEDIRSTENHMANLGMKCNTRRLERASRNRLKLQDLSVDRDAFALASQIAVFRSCPTVVARLLRKGGSLCTAAKILVISRQLHKRLSEGRQDSLDRTWTSIAKLRQNLLLRVDRALQRRFSSERLLLEALSAFALATSSSASEVLRHFHQVRLEAMLALMQDGQDAAKSILRAMQIWIHTIKDTRHLFPKRLAAEFVQIKAFPLLESPDVTALVEIDHETHVPWIGDDIRNFIPYINHDDLTQDTASKMLASWTPSALDQVLRRARALLERVDDPLAIVHLRQSTLELLFSSQSHITGAARTSAVSNLRQAFLDRLLAIQESRCSATGRTTDRIKAQLNHWRDEGKESRPSLWQNLGPTLDASRGVKHFIQQLQRRSHSSNPVTEEVAKDHQTWYKGVIELDQAITELKSTKLDDDIDDDLSSEESEGDEERLASSGKALTTEDPKVLEEALEKHLKEASLQLQAAFKAFVEESLTDKDSGKAAFLLRILRDSMGDRDRIQPVEPDTIVSLHGIIAASVVQEAFEVSKAANLSRDGAVEGETPFTCSPRAFHLLQTLVQRMTVLGPDLWTSAAVNEVRTCLKDALAKESTDIDQSNDAAHVAQRRFDAIYLSQACGSELDDQEGEELSDEIRTKVEKGAKEYWKKASLLFALLSES